VKLESLKALVENFGKEYSVILGIDLKSGRNEEVFKWFLASILFGAPITETSVIKTYRCFQKYNVLTPKRILETGWDGLVEILDEGSYTRYDFKTADKLLEAMRTFMEEYSGNLTILHEKASDAKDLEGRLKNLGKGIGDVTVSIFLRELRGIWKKANPNPTSLVIFAAKNLGIVKEETPEKALQQLEEFWAKNTLAEKSFINFETALLRLGKDFCRRGRCAVCLVKSDCLSPRKF
jgi:endonuclease III